MITFRNLGKLGRFGNQLFQYAGTRLYAQKHDYRCAFPDWIGTNIFQDVRAYDTLEHLRARLLPTVQLADMRSVTPLQRVQRIANLWCQRDIRELYDHPSDNIDLYGYLQDHYSLEMLHREKQKVLSWFRWQPHIERAYRDATKQYPSWTGIHVRRGDFVQRNLTVPIEHYQTALDHLPAHTLSYVSSDDPMVVEQLSRPTTIRPTNPLPDVPDFVFDFWMLANAATIYGCGSTFSWWAAYLSNKNSYYSPLLTHLWPKGYLPALEKQLV